MHCVGSAESKVLVQLYGRRQRDAFATSGRPVEQRHVDGKKPQRDWRVKAHETRNVLK